MGVLTAVLYMAAQCLGAVMGAGLLWVFIVPEVPLKIHSFYTPLYLNFPKDPGQTLVRGGAGLGSTRVTELLGLGQAFVIETVGGVASRERPCSR